MINTWDALTIFFLGLTMLVTTPIFGQSNAPSDSSIVVSLSQTDTSSAGSNENNFFQRKQLTGKWWGGRPFLETHGVTFDFRYSSSYQGLISGTGENVFNYGGKVNALVNLETGKMHLWRGGGFGFHIEYAHGLLNPNIGGVLFSENSAQFWPVNSKEVVVGSSLYYSQKLGKSFLMAFGKFNPIDLLAPDLFFGGWGIDQFMNLIFVAPPSGLVPPIFMGGIFKYKTKPVDITLMVFDPDDRTNDYFPGNLFSNGVNLSLKAMHLSKIAGRTTTYTITANFSTAESVDYSFLQPNIEPQTTKKGSYNISFTFSHNIQENTNQSNAAWSVYFKGAIADGNPNYVRASIIAGLAGKPLFFNRPLDSFGLGYFYYNLSDVLEESLNPSFLITNEFGLEIYYNYSVTPWLFVGADLQYIRPFQKTNNNALVGGFRSQIRL